VIRMRLLSVVAVVALASGGLVGSGPTRAESEDRIPDQFIVDLKDGVNAKKYARRIAEQYGGRATIVYDRVLGGFTFQGPQKAAERLAKDGRVELLEQDRVVRIADAPPTDINHLSRVRVPEAYAAGYTGAGVTIAILDTGVNEQHEVFREHSNILPGHGGCVGERTARDRHDHGTATHSNAVGRIGVAHEAKAIPIKVFPGRSLISSWSRVVCGLNYVLEHASEIDIVNMSIAGPGAGVLRRAVQQVVNAGIVVVAAAGNNGGATQAPARYPGVIAASALANGDRIAPFSSTGEIAAPGVQVFSAAVSGYEPRDGTSRSAPVVAGTAAIILALDPTANVLDVLQRSGTCPGGSTNGTSGPCSGRWRGDDATAEPAANAYCAGVLADPVRVDLDACGF
jgi:subtilisin family serine protease